MGSANGEPLSGGAYYSVVRSTLEEERWRLEREIVEKKGAPTSIRFSPEELAMVEIIRRATGAPNRSEAVRYAVRLAYGLLALLAGARAGRVVIQNPIVNLNINNVKAEAKTEVRIPERLLKALDEVAEFLSYITCSACPPPLKQRVKHNLVAITELRSILSKLN